MNDLLDLVLLLVLLLLVLLVMRLLLLVLTWVGGLTTTPVVRRLVRRMWWHNGFTTRQVDIDTTGVLLGRVLQTQLAANLLDTRLDFLDVTGRVVTLADDSRVEVDNVSRSFFSLLWFFFLFSPCLFSSTPKAQRMKSPFHHQRTHANGPVHATWHIECAPPESPRLPRQIGRVSRLCRPLRDHRRCSPGR